LTLLLGLFILGHLLADFVFQSDKSCVKKLDFHYKTRLKAHLAHLAVYKGISLVLLLVTGILTLPTFLGLMALTGVHGAVDWLKAALHKKVKALPLFLTDQAFHFLTIVLTVWVLEPNLPNQFSSLAQQVLAGGALAPLNLVNKLTIVGIVIILATAGGNVIIREILTALNIRMSFKVSEDEKDMRTGRYIGGVERILTLIAVVAGSYEGVIALYASKTAIRFKHASASPEFEEYYILGTLLSALLGISCGILLKLIL